jgi:hypothetical protein
LPGRFTADRQTLTDRPISTAIYYLLSADEFSAFHSLKSDELWHFYCGTALTIHIIDQNGEYSAIRLGSDFDRGEVFQAVVEAGCWFGAAVESGYHACTSRACSPPASFTYSPAACTPPIRSAYSPSYSLVGCTVAPGFDFSDFRLGDRRELIDRYPKHKAIIERLTR